MKTSAYVWRCSRGPRPGGASTKMIDASMACSRPTSVVEMLLSSRSAIVRMLTLLIQRSVSADGQDMLERVARGPVHVITELERPSGRVVGHAPAGQQGRAAALVKEPRLGGRRGPGADDLLGELRPRTGGPHQLVQARLRELLRRQRQQ